MTTPPDTPDPHEDERSLVDAFGRGEPAAAGRVRGWIERVVRFGRWRFRDPDNVVQEAFVRAYLAVRQGRFGGRSTFRTFVHSLATHVCIDVYRSERSRAGREADGVEPDSAAAPPAPEDAERRIAARERLAALSYVVQRLPAACRELWQWVYVEALAAREIAQRLAITEGNVRVRVHRCLQQARQLAATLETGVPEIPR